MAKPTSRPYSQYSLHALALFGQLIREARIEKAMTAAELSERAGISRALLQRIERGEPGCSIGAAFEVAAICGLQLFGQEKQQQVDYLTLHKGKMALLPKSVRKTMQVVNDDF